MTKKTEIFRPSFIVPVIVLYDRNNASREEIAANLMNQYELALIPPYDHPDIIAGQGTAAKELFEEVGMLDYLFVPVGEDKNKEVIRR